MPATKSFRSGTWASTLLRDDQIGAPVLGDDLLRHRAAEERDLRRNALADRHVGHVGGRLDAEHRDAARHEIAQQVAIVAGELDHRASASSPNRRTMSSV